MTSRTLKQQIDCERKKRVRFWGLLVTVTSLLYGHFIVSNTGYLIAQTEPYLRGLPESVFGYGLIVFGLVKFIGILADNGRMRKWGIIGLSSLWSALFILSFTYSFGTGYPHDSWIFSLNIVLACWRISLKGEFDGL